MALKQKEPKKIESWENRLIIWTIVIIAMILGFAVSSCSALRKLCPRQQIMDSVAVHYKDSTIFKDSLRIRDSLMYVPIPIEGSQNIFQTFIPSHLETSLAMSDAFVDSLGLHHSLKNKEKEIGVHVPVTEHTTTTEHSSQNDSIRVEYVEKIVEVEKPLSSWKQLKLDTFWWLVSLILIALVWIFRKPIVKLIKLIIT